MKMMMDVVAFALALVATCFASEPYDLTTRFLTQGDENCFYLKDHARDSLARAYQTDVEIVCSNGIESEKDMRRQLNRVQTLPIELSTFRSRDLGDDTSTVYSLTLRRCTAVDYKCFRDKCAMFYGNCSVEIASDYSFRLRSMYELQLQVLGMAALKEEVAALKEQLEETKGLKAEIEELKSEIERLKSKPKKK